MKPSNEISDKLVGDQHLLMHMLMINLHDAFEENTNYTTGQGKILYFLTHDFDKQMEQIVCAENLRLNKNVPHKRYNLPIIYRSH